MRQRRSRSDLSEPAALRPDRPRAAALRSALMLETAAELVAQATWTRRQVFIQMGGQGDSSWAVGLFGSDSLGATNQIAAGRRSLHCSPAITMQPKACEGASMGRDASERIDKKRTNAASDSNERANEICQRPVRHESVRDHCDVAWVTAATLWEAYQREHGCI